MKILSMTATFGKLDGQTLHLEPGLNVIHAPNEWGKSTWCAFIVAMLYGIETSQRSSSKGLADKDRYKPWSEKPMSGRMDILWNGRKITLERSSKGRSVFGVFRAYETESGLDVPGLTGDNCGQTLLGVEKSVFLRAGFLRLSDLPVTDDQALRRRLNALVTTGDESGASDKLGQKLKELKNSCRHNKTGLIPQAQLQRDELRATLSQIEEAQVQITRICQRQEAIRQEIALLENHRDHLDYQDAHRNLEKVEAAKAVQAASYTRLRELEIRCADLPAAEYTQKKIDQAEDLQSRWAQLQSGRLPDAPRTPPQFSNAETVRQDADTYRKLQLPPSPLFLILALLAAVLGIGLCFVQPLLILAGILPAVAFAALYFSAKRKNARALDALQARYEGLSVEMWLLTASNYQKDEAAYQAAITAQRQAAATLREQTEALTGGVDLPAFIECHRCILQNYKDLSDARSEAAKARQHAEALAEMVRDLPVPPAPDVLSCSAEQTALRLTELTREEAQLQHQKGSYMGKIQTLGSAEAFTQQLQKVEQRLAKLEDTYTALTIAQETLADVSDELQRRFAPKIAEAARQFFSRITHGRYDRLILAQDLSLDVASRDENTLHGVQWRSDGTADQLYLALRLAVAGELTPSAPLVLDDALVRFDDDRLESVMTLLQEQSQKKQILVFSCQTRESNYL